MNQFGNVFKNKKILITGDTGFKGSWLAIWLKELGAEIYGYALPPKRPTDNFVTCGLEKKIVHIDGDIRDINKLKDLFSEVKPDIAFHLAAQPLVLESYENPHYTFETNILGTVNFFEAVRATSNVKAALNITSDKCYKNNEWEWGYRETDPMGGKDPYSSSKSCSELITFSYENSFFHSEDACAIASARAGNVIGGGDWAENRIIPDFFRSLKNEDDLIVRNPYSTRPWQHVLEPLSGYLLLASRLLTDGKKYSGGWNFGPSDQMYFTVAELIDQIVKTIGKGNLKYNLKESGLHEAKMLKLDISKAVYNLNWRPVLDFQKLIEFTSNGYLDEFNGKRLYEARVNQIKEHTKLARVSNIPWAEGDI